MLDIFIERWLGPLLVCLGLAAAVYGLYGIATTPDPVIGTPVRVIVGAPHPAAPFRIWAAGGFGAFSIGVSLVRYFRRERLAERSA